MLLRVDRRSMEFPDLIDSSQIVSINSLREDHPEHESDHECSATLRDGTTVVLMGSRRHIASLLQDIIPANTGFKLLSLLRGGAVLVEDVIGWRVDNTAGVPAVTRPVVPGPFTKFGHLDPDSEPIFEAVQHPSGLVVDICDESDEADWWDSQAEWEADVRQQLGAVIAFRDAKRGLAVR
jgi:hypothetical protein